MNLNQLINSLNSVYLILLIGAIIGAFFVGRRGRSKEINEANTQLNSTLNQEIEALRRRVIDLERDRNRQYDILDTIRYALRQEGLSIVINGEFVSLLKPGTPNKITRIKSRVAATSLGAEAAHSESQETG